VRVAKKYLKKKKLIAPKGRMNILFSFDLYSYRIMELHADITARRMIKEFDAGMHQQ